jgi:CRP/FNR family transcriptional regulator
MTTIARDRDAARAAPTSAALARSPLFAGLSGEELAEIAAATFVHPLTPGREVFGEGSPCSGLWLVASGQARLVQGSSDGRQRISGFCGPGDPLNLVAALDGGNHSVAAVAAQDTTLLYIPRQHFQELRKRIPRVGENATAEICAEIRRKEITGGVGSLKGAQERVGCVLLHLARRFGTPTPDGTRISYRLSRQDVADRAGTRGETAIRILSSLTGQGMIRTKEQMIEIVNLEGLRESTQCDDCQFDCSVFGPSPMGRQRVAAGK